MKDQAKVLSFEAFSKRAVAKIEERKKRRTKMVHIGDLDADIEIRGMSAQEINECMEYSEDNITNDKYLVYVASKTLQELAYYMKENGQIKNELEVMDMFSDVDRSQLARKVVELSGIYDETTVSEVEEIKNS